jgi:predicted outer membrane repeat protein
MTLQTALVTPICKEIWIKTGTYKPTSGNNRSLSFNIQPKTTVLGGFAGTETNPNDRNIAANPVILSGDIGITNVMTDNSYHVVKLDGTQGTKILASTLIADLEIHDGYGSSGFFDFPNNSGAGLFCDGTGSGSACNPYLSNIRFINNQATGGSGGGMFNDANGDGESSPQLVNVTFENNTAINGGAMYNAGSIGGTSSAIIINSQFNNNSADNSGGAVYNNANGGYNRSQFIFGSFTQNNADYGGAVYNSGQSFGINTSSFNQVTFTSNQASFDGGAFYSAGWNDGMSKPSIQDVTFTSNLAGRGGAVFLNDLAGNGTAELNRVTFNQNLATNGGALYNDGENGFSHPKLTNVTFQSNLAVSNGGAIFNNGDNGASSPDITNVTFSGNNANYGGAMYSSASPSGNSSPILRHVIMWDNIANTEGDTIYHDLAETNLFDSILEDGCPTNGVGNVNCNNVISSNPMLGVLSNNGGHTNTLLPQSGSPAIDGGDNSFCPGEDQRGQSRPNGSACDIGSVEVISQGSTDIIFKNGFES